MHAPASDTRMISTSPKLHDCVSIARSCIERDLGFQEGEGGPETFEAGVQHATAGYVVNAEGGLLSTGHQTGATAAGNLRDRPLQLRRLSSQSGAGNARLVTTMVADTCGGEGHISGSDVMTNEAALGTVQSHTVIRVPGRKNTNMRHGTLRVC